uniref:Uncharacterized protein n=1 Tax=Amphimedon queenslandica TaxID=400682 RepID=A0A1X7TWM0_AMPQE
MLPEDRDLSDLRTVQPVESQEVTTSNDTTTIEHEEILYSLSFVPNAAPLATHRETIPQAVQSFGQPQSSHVTWPSIGDTPINEFQTEGYFSMEFPTLFLTVYANRASQYFTHLMKYDDGRFAKHPSFCFFAVNTEMRWCST